MGALKDTQNQNLISFPQRCRTHCFHGTCSVYRELLDGHKNINLREVINKITGCSINKNIELHNYCEEYLKCSDI